MSTSGLTPAQWRVLGELSEPNSNTDGEWYFPRKNLRTLQALRVLGLARYVDGTFDRSGYAITQKGRELLASGKGSAFV